MPSDPLPPWLRDARRDIGHRVWEARTARGWSQERLAERAGLDRKTVYRTELAQHATSVDQMIRIARALEISPRELLPERLPPAADDG